MYKFPPSHVRKSVYNTQRDDHGDENCGKTVEQHNVWPTHVVVDDLRSWCVRRDKHAQWYCEQSTLCVPSRLANVQGGQDISITYHDCDY